MKFQIFCISFWTNILLFWRSKSLREREREWEEHALYTVQLYSKKTLWIFIIQNQSDWTFASTLKMEHTDQSKWNDTNGKRFESVDYWIEIHGTTVQHIICWDFEKCTTHTTFDILIPTLRCINMLKKQFQLQLNKSNWKRKKTKTKTKKKWKSPATSTTTGKKQL